MQTSAISFIAAAALMAFGYRWPRNGAFDAYLPSKLTGDTLSRLMWGLAHIIGFAMITGDVRVHVLICVFVWQQCSIRVPHGYIMDLGQWKTFETKWPSFLLPSFSQEQWDNLTENQRAAWDGMQGACVGLVRAVFSLIPLALLGYDIASAVAASAVIAAGTPVVYYLSRFIPWNFYGVRAKTVEWAEVMHGPLWALSFLLLSR